MSGRSTPARRRAHRLRLLSVLAIGVTAAAALVAVGAPTAAQAAGSSLAGETFTGATVSDGRWLGLGSACLTKATVTSTSTTLGACTHTVHTPTPSAPTGYLQLTDDSGNQAGNVLYNRPLPSSAGVSVEFRTYQYGGDASGADGIGFFLTDGSYTLTSAGPNGGSLGYSATSAGAVGVPHGYVGVGLDVFGNYSNVPSFQGSGCTTAQGAITSHAATPESVAVRGDGDGAAGYCMLDTTLVSSVQSGARLDAPSTTSVDSVTPRLVRVTVSPVTAASPKPTVTTQIDFGGTGSAFKTVSTVQLRTDAPATYKLGFSASTGGSKQVHLVQGVQVSTVDPVGPVTLTSTIDHTAATGTTRTTFTAGDTVPLQILVSGTGSEPLSDVAVSDPDFATISCPATSLAVADGMVCTGSKVLTADDVASGTWSSTATVTATTASGPVTATSSVSAPSYLARLGVVQAATPAAVTAAGQTVTFTSTVSNSGTMQLTGLALTAPTFTGAGTPSASVCATTTLPVGASTTCTSTYTVRQADVEAGSIARTVQAAATGNAATVTATATATVSATSQPALSLVAAGSPATFDKTGTPVSYSFLVTNTGNRTLQSVGVGVDSFSGAVALGPVTCPLATLAVGSSTTCTADHVVTQADLDSAGLALTASAFATTADGTMITSPTATVQQNAVHGAALAATTTATPATVTAVDQSVQFSTVLVNTGNTTLTTAAVTISSFTGHGTLAAPVCAATTLAPAAMTTCTVGYTTVQADTEAGSITATVTAHATSGGTTVTSPAATTTITAAQLPALSAAASASPTTFDAVGRTLTWSIAVTNTGNVAVHDVAVPVASYSSGTDAPVLACPVAALAVGASTTCTAITRVTQRDLDAGALELRVKARGTAAGTAVSSAAATAAATAVRAAALDLDASVTPATVPTAGKQVRFDLVVRNAGNVTLASPVVTTTAFSGSGALGTFDCAPSALPVGASATCSTTYTVTEADAEAGRVSLSATATAADGATPVTSMVGTTSLGVVPAPAIELRQSVTPNRLTAAGRTVLFSAVVTNTGDAPLRQVGLVVRSFTGSAPGPLFTCPSSALAVGASQTCTAQYTATQADLDAGSVTSTAVATATVHGKELRSAASSATATATGAAALQVVVTAGGSAARTVGQVITYTFAVTNIGSVTAMDPRLTGARIQAEGALSRLACPDRDVLAPGQTMLCTATYVVRAADVGHALVVSAQAVATAPDGTRTTSHPASRTVHLPAAGPETGAELAFTGAGPLGAVVVAALVAGLLLAVALVLLLLLLRRRRTA